jgi:hypothetical protein
MKAKAREKKMPPRQMVTPRPKLPNGTHLLQERRAVLYWKRTKKHETMSSLPFNRPEDDF